MTNTKTCYTITCEAGDDKFTEEVFAHSFAEAKLISVKKHHLNLLCVRETRDNFTLILAPTREVKRWVNGREKLNGVNPYKFN